MLKTPQFLIEAVTVLQEQKREELAALQDEEKTASRAVEAAQATYFAAQEKIKLVKAELEEMRKYLMAAKPADLAPPSSASAPSAAAPAAAETTTPIKLSGRAIRAAVVACADEVAAEKEFFSVDDLMAKIEQKNYVLNVENPRIRASQVLTLTHGYFYSKARNGWTKRAPSTKGSLETAN